MKPKIRQLSILRMPACLCLCCGRPDYNHAYDRACAYVLEKAMLGSTHKSAEYGVSWNFN